MEIKDIQNRIDKWLKYQEPRQMDLFYRISIVVYNLGDVVRWTVYDTYYGDESKVKNSLKSFAADAIIQLLILLCQLGVDVEEVIELGLDKVTHREFDQKPKQQDDNSNRC